MKTLGAASLIALLLAGCALGPPVEKQIWVRSDGQSGRTDPALAAQFATDEAACRIAGQVNKVCMETKGYALVPESQAEARAAEFRAAGKTMPAPPQ